MLPEIHIENICKSFDNKVLFKDLSHSLKLGNSLAISGPNGSGKSTLLKIIAKIIRPDSGSVSYKFKNINNIDNYFFNSISFISPELYLYKELTAMENIELALGRHRDSLNLYCEELISNLKLENDLCKLVKYYSSGMLQKLKLVIALSKQSQILIFDEPTTNLDNESQNIFLNLIKKTINEKIIIIAGNQTNEINFCERKICLG